MIGISVIHGLHDVRKTVKAERGIFRKRSWGKSKDLSFNTFSMASNDNWVSKKVQGAVAGTGNAVGSVFTSIGSGISGVGKGYGNAVSGTTRGWADGIRK